jgi:hypothetical protein
VTRHIVVCPSIYYNKYIRTVGHYQISQPQLFRPWPSMTTAMPPSCSRPMVCNITITLDMPAHNSLDFLMKYIVIGTLYYLFLSFGLLTLAIGEAGTGKSCLLHHFTHNSCTRHLWLFVGASFICGITVKDHSQHTIGVEFSSRTVKLGEKRIKLQVRFFFLQS